MEANKFLKSMKDIREEALEAMGLRFSQVSTYIYVNGEKIPVKEVMWNPTEQQILIKGES